MTADAWSARDPLARRVAATPERTAIVDTDNGTNRTYREFDAAVDERAAALSSLAGRAPTVALLLDTRPAFATLAFATLRLGGTLVPLNTRLTASELDDRVARTTPDLLVCGANTEALARDVGDAPVASVDTPAAADVHPFDSGDETAVEPAPVDPETEWLVLFTSGTTGRPKGVRLTVGNLVSSATASAYRLGVTPTDRWLCCLPMYHMGGFAPVVRSTLYGTTVLLQRSFDAERTADVLADYDATGVSLVPTMLRRLLDAGWDPSPTLRFALLGGAPATTDLLDRALDRNVPVHPTYGMTETASQIATARPEQVSAHAGTVGQPLANTDVTVVGEDGTPCQPGERGELVVAGPTVTPGYLDADVAGAAVGEYGLHTGDAGYRDEDGRLWVLNRLDDRIVTGGENVDPGEVVEMLRDHPAVRDAAVVGLADPEWGERVAALVVPDPEDVPTTDDIETHCQTQLAGFKRPRTVAFADALPRTASGTVDREAVRDRLREDSA